MSDDPHPFGGVFLADSPFVSTGLASLVHSTAVSPDLACSSPFDKGSDLPGVSESHFSASSSVVFAPVSQSLFDALDLEALIGLVLTELDLLVLEFRPFPVEISSFTDDPSDSAAPELVLVLAMFLPHTDTNSSEVFILSSITSCQFPLHLRLSTDVPSLSTPGRFLVSAGSTPFDASSSQR